MDYIENGLYRIKDWSTEMHKSFPIHWPMEEKHLKHILTYICWAKYNEINKCYLNIQNHVFYKK